MILMTVPRFYEISVQLIIFNLATIQCFEFWKSAVMDKSVTFQKRIFRYTLLFREIRETYLESDISIPPV